MMTVVVVLLALVLSGQTSSAVVPNSPQIAGPVPLDFTGVDAFWNVFEVFRVGGQPTPDQWSALLETDAYRFYTGVQRMERLFRDAWPVTFNPARIGEQEALRAARPIYGSYLDHFNKVAARATELKAFQASLRRSSIQRDARELANAYLPEEARTDSLWPTVAFAIAEPDGKAQGDLIVIDLLLAAERGSRLTALVAHELHHVFARRLFRMDSAKAGDPRERLLQAIRQLTIEGVADQIDKPAELATGNPDAVRFQQGYDQSAAIIQKVDELLTQVARAPERMETNARAVWDSLPLAGHPTGYYMARVIRETLGHDVLIGILRNPFSLFARYNEGAALANGRSGPRYPLFSDQALSVIADLERAFLVGTRSHGEAARLAGGPARDQR